MIARARLVVARDCDGRSRVVEARSSLPLVLRQTADAVYLVGGAAGPLGGDDLELHITVEEGAHLVLRSVAASIAFPGRGGEWSRSAVIADIAVGGTLDWAPEPLVAAAGCRHRAEAHIHLGPDAGLQWRDEIVLGRYAEEPGELVSRIDVTGDVPILCHSIELDSSRRWRDPAVVGPAGALGTYFVSWIEDCGIDSSRDGWMDLEGGGALFSVLGSASEVRAALDSARGQVQDLPLDRSG